MNLAHFPILLRAGVMAEIQIRPMLTADLPRAREIDRLSFHMPWPENAFRYELQENEQSFLLVAVLDGDVVGVIVVWLILDEAHIATISVLPELRGRGIGSLLLAAALSKALDLEMQTATLEVRASNVQAQALYHRFLFEEVGRRKRYYMDNQEDALIMTLDLAREIKAGQGYRQWLESKDWSRSLE